MAKQDYRWEFYQDSKEEWRWTKYSVHNGKKVGASSEGFSSKQACVNNAKIMGY